MSIVGALPYTLTNGTIADANQVQANLQFIADQVNANVQTAVNALILTALPIGIVAEWSGTVGSIPGPWQLCDGTNGTPDLRDKFVIGAGGTYAEGATGGAASNTPTITVAGHVLTVAEMPTHSHVVDDPTHVHGVNDPEHSHVQGTNLPSVQGGPNGQVTFGNTSTISTNAAATGITINAAATGITLENTGGGGAHAHGATASAVPTVPPFYALAYIRKMS